MKCYVLVWGCFCLLAAAASAAEPFPSEALPGASVASYLPAGYEASGIVWHPGERKLFLVSDGGVVSSMKADGTGVVHWSVPGDLEAVTVADVQNDFIYLGVENPDSVREFNTGTGLVTRTFDLTPWMTGPSNSGLEALAFVPDPANPEGGLFYAGLQDDGRIYVFELPIASSPDSTAVTHVGTISALGGVNDISDLHYDPRQDALYAIYDTANLLRAMDADGTPIEEWVLPGQDQEGISLRGNDLYVAQDSGDVLRYAGFRHDLLAADANYDGHVNDADMGILFVGYGLDGRTWEDGDFTGDGAVDVGDLGIFAVNYAWPAPPPSAGPSVPEQCSEVLLLAAILLACARRPDRTADHEFVGHAG